MTYDDASASIIIGSNRGEVFHAFWLSAITCLALAMGFTAKASERGRLRFSLLYLSICVTLAYSAVWMASLSLMVSREAKNVPRKGSWDLLSGVAGVFEQLAPLVCQLAALEKVITLYYSTTTNITRLSSIFLPVGVLVLGRVALVIYLMWWNLVPVKGDLSRGATIYLVSYVLQIVYCVSVSTLLLIKARTHFGHAARQSPLLGQRLKAFTEGVLMTLLIPVIPQILCAISVEHSFEDQNTSAYHFIANYASAFNVYLSTLFAVMSTSWSTIRSKVSIPPTDQGSSLGEEALAIIDKDAEPADRRAEIKGVIVPQRSEHYGQVSEPVEVLQTRVMDRQSLAGSPLVSRNYLR